MVPHHQTLTAFTAYAGLEVIVLGKINWYHFQQLDQDSWHNNKLAIVYMCMCSKRVLHLFIIHCINNIIYKKIVNFMFIWCLVNLHKYKYCIIYVGAPK